MIRVLIFLALFFSFSFSLEVNEPLFPKGEKLKEFIINDGLKGKALFVNNKNIFVTLDGTYNIKINFFNLKTKKIFFQIKTESSRISDVSISKDKPYLIYAEQADEQPKVIKFFDINNKKVVKVLTVDDYINALYITNDAKYIVYATKNKKIYIYDIETSKFLSVFNTKKSIDDIKVDALNKYIFSLEENSIVMYDFKTFQKLHIFNLGKKLYWNKFNISKNGKYILSTFNRNKLKVWEIKDKKLILDLNISYINDAQFTSDSKEIIYGERNSLKKINLATHKSVFIARDKNLKEIYNISIGKDSKVLVNDRFLVNTKTAIMINLSKEFGNGIEHYIEESVYVKKLNIIFSRDKEQGIKIWNLQKNSLEYILEEENKINDMMLSKDEQFLVFSTDKSLKVWDIEEKKIIKEFMDNNLTIENLAISSSSKLIVFKTDKKLKILDVKLWKVIKEIEDNSWVSELKFLNDKYLILRGTQEIKVFDIQSGKLINHIKEKKGTMLLLHDDSQYYRVYFYNKIKSEIRDILTNKSIATFFRDNYVYEIFDSKAYIGDLENKKLDMWDLKAGKIVNVEKRQYYETIDSDNSVALMDTNWNDMFDGEKILKKIFYDNDSWAIADYKTKKLYRYGDKDFLLDTKTFQPILPKNINMSKDDIKVFFDTKSIKLINNRPITFNIQIKNISNHKLYWIEPTVYDENFTIETNSIVKLEPNEIKNIQVSIQCNKVVEQSFSKDLTFKVAIGGEVVNKEKLHIEVEKREDIDIENIELGNVGLITVKIHKYIDKNLTNLKVVLSEGNKSIENNPYYDYVYPPIETNESMIITLFNNQTFFYSWGKGHDFTITVDADEIKAYIFKRHINFDMPEAIFLIIGFLLFFILSMPFLIYIGFFNRLIPKIINNPNKIYDIPLDKLPYYKKRVKMHLKDDIYVETFNGILEDDLDRVSNFFKSKNEEKANLFAKKANGKLSKLNDNFFEITLAQNFELSLESFLLYFPNTIDINSIYNILEEKGSTKPIILIGKTEKEQKMLNESDLLHKLPFVLGMSLKNLKIFLLKQEHTKTLSKIFATRLDRKLISPYQEEGQLRNESYFFGREKIIHHIYSRELSNYFIVGARQIGKSSLLKTLELKFKSRSDVICFSFEDTRYLLKDIARALNIDKNSSLEEIEFYIADSSKTYLFIIDEADEFVKNEKNNGYKTLHAFRSLTQKGKAYFIMAGYYELFSQISFDYHSPIKNFGETIHLGKLEFKACANLIVTPMENLGLDYQNIKDGAKIITQTGQRANLIAMVCADIVKNLKPFTNEIRKSDIDKALECTKVRNTHYEWNNNIYRNQRQSYITQIIVYASVRTEYFTLKQVVDMFDSLELNVSIEEIRESLQLLELMYILDKSSDNVYIYTVPLMQKELRKEDEIMLERVVYEFKNNRNI